MPSPQKPPPAPTNVRYVVVALCIAMSLLLYLDRFAMSPLTNVLLRELNPPAPGQIESSRDVPTEPTAQPPRVTKEALGSATFFSFFFAYALMQVPAGWLSDTYGARWTLALYVVGWSLATIGLGLAGGLLSIFLMRMLLGVAQAGAYPAAASLLKRWMPYPSRGLANASVSMGGRAGGVIGFLLTVPLVLLVGWLLGWQTGNWRIVLCLYGSLGIVWAALFLWLYRDRPREHPWVSAAEAELIEGAAAEPKSTARSVGPPIGAMLTTPGVWLLCAISFCVNIGWVFLVSWLPQYLIETHGAYVTEHIGNREVVASWMTALTGLGGMLGSVMGGAATDNFVRRFGPVWGRRLPGVIGGFVVTGLYVAAPLLPNVWLFVAAMIVISMTIDFGLGSIWASYQDIGGRHVASVLGFGNMCGNLAAAGFGWFIGRLADADQWNTVFMISAVAMSICASAWLVFDPTRQVVREAAK
jgi:MFS family permease